MSELLKNIEETIGSLRKSIDFKPDIGIILGTGIGGLADEILTEKIIPYSEIPHFPLSTVESHSGNLIFGCLSGRNVLAMQGRFHYYEGYTMQQVTYPVRVMKALGVNTLIVSNACGTVNPYFRKGNIMLIDDHINLLGDNPLIGRNEKTLGVRYPDMSEQYSKRLIETAESIALVNQIKLYKGVYAALSGPCLETRAEYRFLRTIGADVIGMSTVPEVIVARHSSMEVLGLSVITDECYPDALKTSTIDEIIHTASTVEPNLKLLTKEIVKLI
ncbi:MAG: purine-nucleoside phosphorylase [Bacteroidota bacterium]|nr:purine-nucleoside phosphorylase [Bacteroidota bacterium]